MLLRRWTGNLLPCSLLYCQPFLILIAERGSMLTIYLVLDIEDFGAKVRERSLWFWTQNRPLFLVFRFRSSIFKTKSDYLWTNSPTLLILYILLSTYRLINIEETHAQQLHIIQYIQKRIWVEVIKFILRCSSLKKRIMDVIILRFFTSQKLLYTNSLTNT